MEQINMGLTKFHGESYIEDLDRDRLTGQVKRLFEVLKSGVAYRCDELSELSNVAMGSIPKRASDLRIYHGYIIEANRVTDCGLHTYQLIGREDKTKKVKKKIKPIGNPELFGKMLEAINAYAAKPTQENNGLMSNAANKWALSFAGEIGDLEYLV